MKQAEAWRVEHVSPWNGGTLTTAGNLVFQGLADGRFVAFNATTGEKLWESPTGTGIVAAPATYMVDGVQYVSIAVGWGGVFGLRSAPTTRKDPARSSPSRSAARRRCRNSRSSRSRRLISGIKYDKDASSPAIYVSDCAQCHGVPGVARAATSPISATSRRDDRQSRKIRVQGTVRDQGMPDFTGKLKEEDIPKLQAFIQGTADAIRPKSN